MLFRRRRRSHARSVFIGIFAMGLLLWASAYRFNVPVDVLLEYFKITLLVSGGTILFAGLSALLLLSIRRLLRRGSEHK